MCITYVSSDIAVILLQNFDLLLPLHMWPKLQHTLAQVLCVFAREFFCFMQFHNYFPNSEEVICILSVQLT